MTDTGSIFDSYLTINFIPYHSIWQSWQQQTSNESLLPGHLEGKAREYKSSMLILNLKRIPYRTEWISYPDIEGTFKQIGIEPTTKNPDGRDFYTCPAIIDPVSPEPKRLADSVAIAEYLDSAYSDASFGPPFLPETSKSEQLEFIKNILTPVANTIGDLVRPLVPSILEDPRGSEYFMKTKRGPRGETMDVLYPAGSKSRAAALEQLKTELDLVAKCYDSHPDGKNWLYLGEGVVYVDIWLAARFLFARFVPSDRDGEGVESVWDIIKTLNGGRWMNLMDEFEPYLKIR